MQISPTQNRSGEKQIFCVANLCRRKIEYFEEKAQKNDDLITYFEFRLTAGCESLILLKRLRAFIDVIRPGSSREE